MRFLSFFLASSLSEPTTIISMSYVLPFTICQISKDSKLFFCLIFVLRQPYFLSLSLSLRLTNFIQFVSSSPPCFCFIQASLGFLVSSKYICSFGRKEKLQVNIYFYYCCFNFSFFISKFGISWVESKVPNFLVLLNKFEESRFGGILIQISESTYIVFFFLYR